MIDDRFIYNYRFTSMKMLREYMKDEIINDHRNDYVELIPDTKNKDVGIDKQDFENSNKILFIKKIWKGLSISTPTRSLIIIRSLPFEIGIMFSS